MKLKNMIALLLAVCLCMGLCACGGSDPKETTSASQGKPEDTATDAPNTTEAPAAQAQTATWGDWTIDVPAGCELKGGGFMDENDGRYFSVKKSSFSYFDFSADGEEQIMNHYNYNKSAYTNEQKDVSGTFGGTEWTGFQYSDGFGGYGFEAYATVDGEMIRVSAVGYAFDSELANAVLSSLKHTPSADPEPQPSESEPETEPADTAASTEATEYEPSEGAPVYARSIEFSDMMMGIREGYTELKNGLPSMSNAGSVSGDAGGTCSSKSFHQWMSQQSSRKWYVAYNAPRVPPPLTMTLSPTDLTTHCSSSKSVERSLCCFAKAVSPT